MVFTTANFGGFSNFCRYYTRSQTGKSTGYRPTLKPLYSGTCAIRHLSFLTSCDKNVWFQSIFGPPLKICLFSAPNPPFHLWVGRKGDFFFFFQNRLHSFTNLVPSKSSNGFCSFKSVNQFRT